jgi:hypothetical protein
VYALRIILIGKAHPLVSFYRPAVRRLCAKITRVPCPRVAVGISVSDAKLQELCAEKFGFDAHGRVARVDFLRAQGKSAPSQVGLHKIVTCMTSTQCGPGERTVLRS